MQQTDTAIEVKDLSFSYETASKERIFSFLPFKRVRLHKHQALRNVNVCIRPNRITTLLGKNGSGKTTLIKLLCGARLPHSGSVTIFGKTPNQVRHKIGLFFGNMLIYHRLTARENLEYFARLYNVRNVEERIHELCTLLALNPYLDQLVESYSFGMKIKLGLARAMIHTPEILILDEPTLGIDLHLAQQVRKFIRKLPCTVLLTTHYMEEAESLSDDLCIIDRGQILAYGSKDSVLKDYRVDSVPEVFTAALEPESKSQQQPLSDSITATL